jgi:hypothetical protein
LAHLIPPARRATAASAVSRCSKQRRAEIRPPEKRQDQRNQSPQPPARSTWHLASPVRCKIRSLGKRQGPSSCARAFSNGYTLHGRDRIDRSRRMAGLKRVTSWGKLRQRDWQQPG